MGLQFGTKYQTTTAQAADYSAASTDDIVQVTAATTPVVITLPTPVGLTANNSIRIQNLAASRNFVTVATAAGSIVGNVTLFPGQSETFTADGIASWANYSPQGTSGTITVALTTAQVLLLKTTPVQIIPAPGAGKVVIVESVVGKIVFNSIAYTGANNIEVRFTDGSGVKATADLTAAWLNTASGTAFYAAAAASGIPVANAAVVVAVPTADPGAGNSPVTFSVKYRIV